MKPNDLKCQEAKIRQEECNKLTPRQRLAYLDAHGFVAKKERTKLQARIDAVATGYNLVNSPNVPVVQKEKYHKGPKYKHQKGPKNLPKLDQIAPAIQH